MTEPSPQLNVDTMSALQEKLDKLEKQNFQLHQKQSVLLKKIETLEEINKVSKIGGWQLDILSGRIAWTNVTREIHEVALDYEPDYNSVVTFYKGENYEKILRLVDEAVEYGTPYDEELQIITARGNEVWVRAQGNAEFENGKCVRLFGTFQNIHNEKLKDIQLAQSEEQFRQTFLNAAIGMSLISLEGKWLKVNNSLCKMLGYTEKELQEMFFQQVTPQEDLIDELPLFEKLTLGKKQNYQLEKKYIHKKGHTVCVIKTVSVIKNSYGKPLHLIAQVIDISSRKQVEQIVRKEQQLLRTLIDNIPLNIYIKNLQSQKTLINKNELTYLGIENEAQVLGKNDFELYPEESAKISVAEDNEVFNTGVPILNRETLNIKKDGTTNWFLTSKIPLKDERNNITGLLGISYDIHEKKEVEQNAKLLMNVTNEQNTRLMNFAHIVSHNMRSHAANFSMLIELIEYENDEEEKKNLFQLLKNASSGLRETVNNLNEIVAVNSNLTGKLQTINLYNAVEKVQHDIKAMMMEQQAKFTNTIDRNINIQAVPAYIDSIFLNFFTNSIKYKSPSRPPVIKLTSEKDGNFVVVSFGDNGRGIDLDKYGDSIFGLYKTFHGNKDAQGVGMFITKNQVEAMGGRIDVQSTVNEGTTFKVYLKST